MEATGPDQGNEMNKVLGILQEAARLRKTKARVSAVFGVIIFLLIVFLALDIYSYIKNYKAEVILTEINAKMPLLMRSVPMKNLISSIKSDVLPTYIDELTKQLKKRESSPENMRSIP